MRRLRYFVSGMSATRSLGVLVIDNDSSFRRQLETLLLRGGYAVTLARDLRAGLSRLETATAELVLVDPRPEEWDSGAACQRIRERSGVPIVILSNDVTEADLVRGLGAGADDYICKFVGTHELMARVEAVLRRRQLRRGSPSRGLTFDGLTIDTAQHRALLRGRELRLTRREYRLLYMLALNAGMALSLDELLSTLWGAGQAGRPEPLYTLVRHLRRRFGDHGGRRRYVLTERGRGYASGSFS